MTIERIENPLFRITWECLEFKIFIEDIEVLFANNKLNPDNSSHKRILKFLSEANKKYNDKNS